MTPAKWEVPFEKMAGDFRVLRNDLKNMIENSERDRRAAKPAEDRAKMIDAFMKAALAGLVVLEGVSRAPAIEVGTSTPSNGAVIFFGGIYQLVGSLL